jgi:hypothetical protein
MSDADASNVAHDLRLAVGRLARRLQQQPPCLPDRGDEPAEAGIGRRIARIAW